MGTYIGADLFSENIYQFEETDVVQGGPSGIDNVPLQNLADRTIYLYNRMGQLKNLAGESIIVANESVDNSAIGKILTVKAPPNTAVNLNLNPAGTFAPYSVFTISSYCGYQGIVNVVAPAGQYFYDADGNRSRIYMHHKDHITVVACNDHFKIINPVGNFYCAGEEVKSRRAIINTVAPKGQLLSRTLYARLWEFVQTLTFGQEVVSEAVWFSNDRYCGCYTTGDGVTNFRLPDERSTTDRMLDLGRGWDLSREHAFPGGYQPDMVKSHNHTFRDRYFAENNGTLNNAPNREWMPPGYNAGIGSRGSDNDNNMFLYFDSVTGNNAGGSENTVKNIAKLNLIKF